jgi:ATP-dependent Lhr-like helicase
VTDALAGFHPHVRAWFEATFAAPTDATEKLAGNRRRQPCVDNGPNRCGKTLTAFLWPLTRSSADGMHWGDRVLYVSPLKALNNDVQRNLVNRRCAARTAAAGDSIAPIRVQVRSGDTPSDERQRLCRRRSSSQRPKV